jgi:hypothetical protein
MQKKALSLGMLAVVLAYAAYSGFEDGREHQPAAPRAQAQQQ